MYDRADKRLIWTGIALILAVLVILPSLILIPAIQDALDGTQEVYSNGSLTYTIHRNPETGISIIVIPARNAASEDAVDIYTINPDGTIIQSTR